MNTATNSTKDAWLLGVLLFVFVGLIPMIYGLSFLDPSGYLSMFIFLPLLLWTFLPGCIFGQAFFRLSAFGYWPSGVVGWILTIGFYTAVAVALWAAIHYSRRDSSHAHA
jgi:hypothetical protein